MRYLSFEPAVFTLTVLLRIAWAALINTVDAPGIPDFLLTLVVLGFFFLGFVIGVFNFARLGGIVLLSICGGLAFGIRIILVKDGLLLSDGSLFAVNWAIIAVCGAAGGLVLVWAQRAGIVRFLFNMALGIDYCVLALC